MLDVPLIDLVAYVGVTCENSPTTIGPSESADEHLDPGQGKAYRCHPYHLNKRREDR